jgi:hypothetical protein
MQLRDKTATRWPGPNMLARQVARVSTRPDSSPNVRATLRCASIRAGACGANRAAFNPSSTMFINWAVFLR